VSENNPFRIFPAHAWERDEDYMRLFEYLESTTNFFYQNVCDPDISPAGEGVADRRTRILDAMKMAEVVLIPAGLVLAHKDWADFIISAAKAHDLPIVALEHFGPHELPDELRENADKVVGWNSRTIEDAIRMASRHDDTKRFDTIEFDLS
jgi:hypothetical protein